MYPQNTLKLFRTSINIALRSEKKPSHLKKNLSKQEREPAIEYRLNRSFRPKVDSPDGSLPGLISPGSPDVYLSFFTPEKKKNKRKKTVTAHVESKLN